MDPTCQPKIDNVRVFQASLVVKVLLEKSDPHHLGEQTYMELVNKFTQVRFVRWKFYLKKRKLRQRPKCNKAAKNMIIQFGVFTLDNLIQAIWPRYA